MKRKTVLRLTRKVWHGKGLGYKKQKLRPEKYMGSMLRSLGLTPGHWEARMGCEQGVTWWQWGVTAGWLENETVCQAASPGVVSLPPGETSA